MYDENETRREELTQRYKSGANWFYWIAGLTLVTSFLSFSGTDWRFLISLGTTQVIDALAAELSDEGGGAPKIIAIVLDVILAGVFVVFGVLANKKLLWAYILGMTIFVLDGVVSLVVEDWIGAIAHVVVLVFMVPGFLAGRELVDLEERMARAESQATTSI
ncbi:MAG TPA: hypothetical protein VFD62_20640 [Pyrinomonadaceae bacterium]|nr:hypothetical protein [Pyrinomonadaceae bacterium]